MNDAITVAVVAAVPSTLGMVITLINHFVAVRNVERLAAIATQTEMLLVNAAKETEYRKGSRDGYEKGLKESEDAQ